MNQVQKKQIKRLRRKNRTMIKGDGVRPRLSVFRSLKHVYTQVIDDQKGVTLASATDAEIKTIKGKKKTDIAFEVGKLLAKKAKEKGVGKVVFDKGRFLYHGRVKAVADGARDGGLDF